MARFPLAAMAVLAAVLLLVSEPPAGAQEPISASLTGPSAIAPGQPTTFDLAINGGPSGAVTYSVRWHVTGPDVSGAFPSSTSPATTTGDRRTFQLNVTAPLAEQTITLVVRISSSVGSTFENTSVEKSIIVITPIVLSATFRNDGVTAAVNVTVRFYVDNALAGTQKVARIEPHGGQATATYSYLPAGLQPGTHTVRIEADLDGNGVIDPARGEVVASSVFYRGTPPLSTGWNVLIGIAVFLPVLLVTVALRRRGRM